MRRARPVVALVVTLLSATSPDARAFVQPRAQARARSACPIGMVQMPAGAFSIHATNQAVTVDAYCIDTTEVIQDDYAVCVIAGSCAAPGTDCGSSKSTGKGRNPQTCVNYWQADAYCRFRHARLPSEAEWEWAARGGSRGTRFPWGDDPPGDRICWSGGGTSRSETCPIDAHPLDANPYGVRNLSGNAWEWTGAPAGNEPQQHSGRGGYYANVDDSLVSAHNRPMLDESTRFDGLSFRCAAASR
jgi:formylglycine-generating enzyme